MLAYLFYYSYSSIHPFIVYYLMINSVIDWLLDLFNYCLTGIRIYYVLDFWSIDFGFLIYVGKYIYWLLGIFISLLSCLFIYVFTRGFLDFYNLLNH